MRKIIVTLVLFSSIALIFSGFMNKPKKSLSENAILNFNDRINAFGFEMVKNLDGISPHKNFIISPISASIAMSMVLNGANEDTHKEILDALHFIPLSNNEINQAYLNLSESFNDSTNKDQLLLSNAIFIRDKFSVLKPFTKTLQANFNAPVTLLDFSNPQSVNQINQWVSKATKGTINKAVNQLKPNDMMVLLNAIYFKGSWQTPFNPSKNIKMPFFNEHSGQKRNVTTLVQKKLRAKYFKTPQVSSVILTYIDEGFEMLLFKPEGKNTTFSILNNIEIGQWQEWQNLYEKKNSIELYLPKFRFEGEYDLKSTLMEMGVKNAFTENANFKNISNTKLYISDIKQSTFVAVDEKGTEAAAVTKIGMSLTSMAIEPENKIEFKLDKSFIFILREKKSGTICFIGRVMFPEAVRF